MVLQYNHIYIDYASKVFSSQLTPSGETRSVWSPPPLGFVKINTDAGFIGDEWAGLGAVCRNNAGELVAVGVRRVKGICDVVMAECLAVNWGMKLARRLGVQKVILESDALMPIRKLQSKADVFAPYGLILDDIKYLSNSFLEVAFSHVKRVGNTIAHVAARLSPSSGDEQVFVSEFPQGIIALVEMDYAS